MIKIFCIFSLIIFSFIGFSESKISVEQLIKAGEMMKSVCQPKFKVSDDMVNNVHIGEFPDDKAVKCYVNCMLEMMNAIRKGKILYESSMKQIDLMVPDELKEPTKKAVDNCKDSANNIKDNCDAAYALLKCFFNNKPNAFYA